MPALLRTASQPTPGITTTAALQHKRPGVTEKKLGYVTGAQTQNGTHYIKIDCVEMYPGDQAIQQVLNDDSNVVEQDDENGGTYIPGGYYIRNANNTLRTFPLDPGCAIAVYDQSDPGISKSTTFSGSHSLAGALMHVDVKNGVVVSMNQQYLP